VAAFLVGCQKHEGLQRAKNPSKRGEFMSGFTIIMLVAVAVMLGGGILLIVMAGKKKT
jgi:hypothetical protein